MGGRIRRLHGLSLPDALIAATAMAGEMRLVTRNLRHFKAVPHLELHEPGRPDVRPTT